MKTLRWLIAAFLLAFPVLAQAHLLPQQTATMHIVDKSAFLVVAVPATALTGVDDDASGKLSPQEIARHSETIRQNFVQRFNLSDKDNPGEVELTWIMSPLTDGETYETVYVLALQRVNFAKAPANPKIRTDLFGTKAGENEMTVKASRDDTVEIAVLRPDASAHTFFRGSFATFGDFLRLGFEHIWTGYDHLLFLLTIVMVGAGWRHWLAVVTGFTAAHSITLTLSALNVLRIDLAIVEPGIAASIVVMALVNLRALAKCELSPGWQRVGVVFACGLLHGFGFGSAIGSMAVDTGQRIATLAGFNLGIELGQFLFVGMALAIIAALARFGRGRLAVRVPQVASGIAALLGSMLLIQRIALS